MRFGGIKSSGLGRQGRGREPRALCTGVVTVYVDA